MAPETGAPLASRTVTAAVAQANLFFPEVLVAVVMTMLETSITPEVEGEFTVTLTEAESVDP